MQGRIEGEPRVVEGAVVKMPPSDEARTYRVSQKKVVPYGFLAFFRKRLGIFSPNFTCQLQVSIYAGLQNFIQLSATLTKLRYIKRDHPVHIICSKCVYHRPKHARWVVALI